MKYRISKTAIIGLPYYFAFLLLLMPYKFDKSNPGSPFQLSRVRVVMSIITWVSTSAFFLQQGNYLICLWNITCAYFFAVIYSQNKIMMCLNSMYTLLKTTKFKQSIILPVLIVFSSFLARVLICIPITAMFYDLDIRYYSIEFMYFLNFSLETTFNSLCFATASVFWDIGLQISSLGESRFTRESYLRLIHVQWKAYHQADLIAQAFSPFLFNYIVVNTSAVMYVLIYFRKTITHFSIYIPLFLSAWSLSVMCYCSQLMDSEAEKLLLKIQELLYKNTSPEDRRQLVAMMEKIRLHRLRVPVQGCFKLHFPLLLTLANVFVTYMVVLLGFM